MLEICDGFDTYNLAQMARRYNSINFANVSLITPGANGSGQALRLNSPYGYWNSGFLTVPLTPQSGYVVGFNGRSDQQTNLLSFNSLAGVICAITTTPAGAITTPYGNSSTGIALFNAWQTIQAKLVISPTVGSLIVKLDGVVAVNLSGLNTGSSAIVSVTMRTYNPYTSGNTFDLDDFWALNLLGSHSNDLPLGRMTVQRQLPASDGANQGLVPSAGTSHSAMIGEAISDDDATYLVGQTPGLVDTCVVSALTGTIARVHGAVITAIFRKDDVDSKSIHVVGLSGATLAESPDTACPLAYASASLVLADDPNTSAEWTVAHANGLQPGVKIVA